MIEQPPKVDYLTPEVVAFSLSKEFNDTFNNIEKEYPYWDKAKFLIPSTFNKELYWAAIKLKRLSNSLKITFNKLEFRFPINTYFQKTLHDFDMNFGGSLTSSQLITEKNKLYYQLSSIMEEAIASSQMEGANTTRKVAKEMLRGKKKPQDKSQQMILNNYNTIQYLSEHKNQDITPDFLLLIHKMITEKTLDNSLDEGAFRKTDDIVVQDCVTGEIVHSPPQSKEIPEFVKQLCDFINTDTPDVFIHPIIKAIIIHFLISYFHPFVDGNGRTARSIFFWYMLKKGYWLTEFLSISRVIYKSKAQYEKAFLYSESDNLDLGYFIQYNINALEKSFFELTKYLEKKSTEQNAILEYSFIPNINERQAQIIKIAKNKPSAIFTSKEFETRFDVSVKTLRTDLKTLVALKLLRQVPLNNRLSGYTLASNFTQVIAQYAESEHKR